MILLGLLKGLQKTVGLSKTKQQAALKHMPSVSADYSYNPAAAAAAAAARPTALSHRVHENFWQAHFAPTPSLLPTAHFQCRVLPSKNPFSLSLMTFDSQPWH